MQECLQQNDSPLTLLAGSRSVANGNSMHAFRLRRPITSYRRSECLYILYVAL
jgi:metal-dependent HD superfamily phosphatase/phosphodiesterase